MEPDMSNGKEAPASEPSRILLPRFDTLGDLVLLEGFLEALIGRFPRAHITLMVRRAFCDLAGLFPDSLEWLPVDIDPHSISPEVPLARTIAGNLGNEPWDLILVTAHNRTWADDLVAAAMPNARRLALGVWEEMPENFKKVLAELALRADCPYDRLIDVDDRSHETEKYQALWNALDGSDILPEPVLRVSEYQHEAARQILDAAGLQSKRFFIGCPAGTQKVAIKAWPPEHYAEAIAWIESRYAQPCLLIGHQSEVETVRRVAGLAEDRGAHPRIWLGRDGEIPLLAALLASASFYLGNDTGPMHMAAAVNIPVIAIFGGGTWPRFLPRGSRSTAIAGDMPCFGCNWSCLFGDAPCMRLVTIEDVKHAIRDLLEAAAAPGFRYLRASNRLSAETAAYIEKAIKIFQAINDDRRKRLDANLRAEKLLRESELDRAARLVEIERLGKLLAESEADRAARLVEMERLGKLLAESEAGRAECLAWTRRLEKVKNTALVKSLIKLKLIR